MLLETNNTNTADNEIEGENDPKREIPIEETIVGPKDWSYKIILHQHLIAKRIKRAEFQLRFFDRFIANFKLFGIVDFRRLCTFDFY